MFIHVCFSLQSPFDYIFILDLFIFLQIPSANVPSDEETKVCLYLMDHLFMVTLSYSDSIWSNISLESLETITENILIKSRASCSSTPSFFSVIIGGMYLDL